MENKENNLLPKIRVVQAVMVGISALGVSMMAGDLAGAWNFPVSPFSITTTIFGAGGDASGVNAMASFLPIIAVVIAAVMVTGILTSAFSFGQMGAE